MRYAHAKVETFENKRFVHALLERQNGGLYTAMPTELHFSLGDEEVGIMVIRALEERNPREGVVPDESAGFNELLRLFGLKSFRAYNNKVFSIWIDVNTETGEVSLKPMKKQGGGSVSVEDKVKTASIDNPTLLGTLVNEMIEQNLKLRS